MKRAKIKKRYIVFVIALLFLGVVEFLRSKYSLSNTTYYINLNTNSCDYTLSDKKGIRIIQLTDIHDSIFGKDNTRLVTKIAAEHPDVIFITGDLVNSHKSVGTARAQNIISKLVKIAPVYVSLGNQEKTLIDNYGVDVINDYENAGAVVLEYSFTDIEIDGIDYRIGGLYGYCQPVAYAKETHRDAESEFLLDFQNTDACKLLLCHMPVSWISSYSLYDWDVDVVFSGHVHGGQIRIPIVGGFWAPDFGWFPGKLEGIYTTNQEVWNNSREKLLEFSKKMHFDTTYYEEHNEYSPSFLVLSRGLGNTDWMPRFNNPPEIVVVDLALEELPV